AIDGHARGLSQVLHMAEMPRVSPKMNPFRLKRRDALLIGTALFIAITVLDRATANALSLAAFYLFPILLVAWNCGRGWGILFALTAVGTALSPAPMQQSAPMTP